MHRMPSNDILGPLSESPCRTQTGKQYVTRTPKPSAHTKPLKLIPSNVCEGWCSPTEDVCIAGKHSVGGQVLHVTFCPPPVASFMGGTCNHIESLQLDRKHIYIILLFFLLLTNICTANLDPQPEPKHCAGIVPDFNFCLYAGFSIRCSDGLTGASGWEAMQTVSQFHQGNIVTGNNARMDSN